MTNLRITYALDGARELLIDGVDVSRRVRSIQLPKLSGGPDSWPVSVIELPHSTLTADIDGEVILDEQTTALLISIGWRPPVEDQP